MMQKLIERMGCGDGAICIVLLNADTQQGIRLVYFNGQFIKIYRVYRILIATGDEGTATMDINQVKKLKAICF